jgi:hypothetical protein
MIRRGSALTAVTLGALVIGVWWPLVLAIALLVGWGIWYDYRHPRTAGWIAPRMGSLAVLEGADPTFVSNASADHVADPSGRTFDARRREPSPEQRAVMAGGGSGLLGTFIVSLAWVAGVLALVWFMKS